MIKSILFNTLRLKRPILLPPLLFSNTAFSLNIYSFNRIGVASGISYSTFEVTTSKEKYEK